MMAGPLYRLPGGIVIYTQADVDYLTATVGPQPFERIDQ
jgi:hypothetical protein